MDISIIIVNLNTSQLLQECLSSIYACTKEVTFEVIVVDNHSSDDSVPMLKARFPQVRLIENTTNNRYAIANNQGLAIAQGTYVLYLNSDILLHGNTLKELRQFLETHQDAAGVGGKLVYPDDRHQNSCFRFPSALTLFYVFCFARFYWKTPLTGTYASHTFTSPQRVDFVVGACFMARRSLLIQCQGMDSDYYLYGEDSDLCYRMQQLSWHIYYDPTTIPIIHYGGASTDVLFGSNQQHKLLWGWKARFLFAQKHYTWWSQWGIAAAMAAGFGINLLLYSLAGIKGGSWNDVRRQIRFCWQILQEALMTLSPIHGIRRE